VSAPYETTSVVSASFGWIVASTSAKPAATRVAETASIEGPGGSVTIVTSPDRAVPEAFCTTTRAW
jgi:hypothetical protein